MMSNAAAHILVVDADDESRRQLGKLLQRDGFQVADVPCLVSAVESTLQVIPDVIVISRFLAILHAEVMLRLRNCHTPFAGVPIVVYGDPGEAADELLAFGLDDFVALPLDYRFLRLRLRMLVSRRKAKGVQGDLAHMPILDLVQVFSSFGRSGVLVVETVTGKGTIYFHLGQIVAAQVGAVDGEEALLELLRAAGAGGSFTFEAGSCAQVVKTIFRPTSHILLGLANVLDEAAGPPGV
ncbi:MAG: DUF4388 domain-containing protein [bacterium]|nr:DUF4388 domain-containing protein [bacterium]